MANDYMDHFTINGVDVNIQDYGRDQPNGVPVLDPQGKLPTKYLPNNYANELRVDPEDTYGDSFTDWTVKLASNEFQTRGSVWRACVGASSSFIGKKLLCIEGFWLSIGTGAMWSEDGENWTPCSGLTSSTSCLDVAYADGLWLIATDANSIWWSENGKSWTKGTDLGSTIIHALCNAQGIWIAGTSTGMCWSVDGKNWQAGTGVSSSIGFLYYANGIFLAGSNATGGGFWSEDGKNWTAMLFGYNYESTPEPEPLNFFAFTYANGVFVCASGGRQASMYCFWSADGKIWYMAPESGGSMGTWITQSFVFANGIWVKSQLYSPLSYSVDGKSWTKCSDFDSVGNSRPSYPMYIEDWQLWVCTGEKGCWWSEDGMSWTRAESTAGYNMQALAYSHGVLVCGNSASTDSAPWYSTDGKNWTKSTVPVAIAIGSNSAEDWLQGYGGKFVIMPSNNLFCSGRNVWLPSLTS